MTWFWAGGMQDSRRQTNHSMGCSSEVPIKPLSSPNAPKKTLGDDAALSRPSMSKGETMNLERETMPHRFGKEMVVVESLPRPVFLAGGADGRPLFPKPAPRANEETNTSKDRGLAAFPKFCAVSNTTPNSAGVVVAVVDDNSPTPVPPTNSVRNIGIVATTIPTSTPSTGGGNMILIESKISSFLVVVVAAPILFLRFLLSTPPPPPLLLLLSNKTDRPKLQKKGDQPTKNMETKPVLSARLSLESDVARNRESQKISGTTPAFPKEAHTAVPRASSESRSSSLRNSGYSSRIVTTYNTKDWIAARAGTASELLVRPYLVIVLTIEVPKKRGNKILNVVWLRALMMAVFNNPRSMEAIPTAELTTSSRDARVAALTAGFVRTDAAVETKAFDVVLAAADDEERIPPTAPSTGIVVFDA
mmetsp:Transcript_10658/g.22554  ORF Transcript_10658/g.22554 Transcript_10658/m.22554 type:complete len:419 (-) Transcript_10658:93-1349(-)